MIEQAIVRPRYAVSVHEFAETPGVLTFTFVPNELQQKIKTGGVPKAVPQYIVDVRNQTGQIMFDWRGQPLSGSGTTQDELEEEVRARLIERKEWIARVSELVRQVEQWARELDWSTRRIEKRLDDSRIGKHNVPALMMQYDTTRVILEPVARSVPGGDGLAELSLMPSYSDIASLYMREDRWYVHYVFPETKTIAAESEPQTRPLSREVLKQVLEGMKSYVEVE